MKNTEAHRRGGLGLAFRPAGSSVIMEFRRQTSTLLCAGLDKERLPQLRSEGEAMDSDTAREGCARRTVGTPGFGRLRCPDRRWRMSRPIAGVSGFPEAQAVAGSRHFLEDMLNTATLPPLPAA
jgi:hypothetical protein